MGELRPADRVCLHGPRHLIWLLPLAAISRDRILVGATILLTLFQVINGVPI